MYLSAHRELRASPRKPNVATVVRSENSRSLEVWCFSVRDSKFSGATPLPLSATSTSSEPCSFSLTSCVCVCGVCVGVCVWCVCGVCVWCVGVHGVLVCWCAWWVGVCWCVGVRGVCVYGGGGGQRLIVVFDTCNKYFHHISENAVLNFH